MKRILAALWLWTLWLSVAMAQTTGVPYFPQVVPAGTLIGRSAVGPGPAEAIPFSRLTSMLTSVPWAFASTVSVAGNLSTAGDATVAGQLVVTGNLTTAASYFSTFNYVILNRMQLTSSADGAIAMTNYGNTGLTSFTLGPVASANYPSLLPTGSAGTMQIKVADGSAFSQVETGPHLVKTSGGTMTTQTDTNGHVRVGGTAPALTSCGTSPTIVGNDRAGTVTMGTGSPTGCVITFAAAYGSTPICVGSWPAQALASQSYVVSTTAITLTQTATSSNIFRYICYAQSGG